MKRRTFNNQHGIASDFVLVIIALLAILFLAAWVALNNTKAGPDDAEAVHAEANPASSAIVAPLGEADMEPNWGHGDGQSHFSDESDSWGGHPQLDDPEWTARRKSDMFWRLPLRR